jgi:transcriptional regulator with XRE-family HTH domain
MSQTDRIIGATKRALRRQGLTYADVARALDLSEPSVKRLFARGGFSLERLEAIARLLGMEVGDLVRSAERADDLPRQLTLEQEAYLIERPKLLLVFYLLLNDYTVDRITDEFRLDRPEGILQLRELDRLGLIEHQPGDRARLLVSRELAWRRDGPIRRFIDERVLREFLGAAFDGDHDAFHFRSGLVSPAGLAQLQGDIERLVRRFNEQLRAESANELERRQGCSLLVAMRPWQFSVFDEYRRDSNAPTASD